MLPSPFPSLEIPFPHSSPSPFLIPLFPCQLIPPLQKQNAKSTEMATPARMQRTRTGKKKHITNAKTKEWRVGNWRMMIYQLHCETTEEMRREAWNGAKEDDNCIVKKLHLRPPEFFVPTPEGWKATPTLEANNGIVPSPSKVQASHRPLHPSCPHYSFPIPPPTRHKARPQSQSKLLQIAKAPALSHLLLNPISPSPTPILQFWGIMGIMVAFAVLVVTAGVLYYALVHRKRAARSRALTQGRVEAGVVGGGVWRGGEQKRKGVCISRCGM